MSIANESWSITMSYIFLSWLICVWMLSKKNFEMLYENVENQMLKINIFDLGIIFCSLTFKRKACFLENSKFVLRSFMCPTFLMMSGTYPKIFQGWDIPPPPFFQGGGRHSNCPGESPPYSPPPKKNRLWCSTLSV